MKIGITFNLKDDFSPEMVMNAESHEEFDVPQTIDAICETFKKYGHETVRLGGGIDIIERLKSGKVDFVFNIAEGYSGRNRESCIPSILEMLNIPYSGSDPLTLGLTLDKVMTKKIAFHAGIPTPNYQLVRTLKDLAFVENKLGYPLITKPAWEGSSKGIYDSSKVFDRGWLEESVKSLFERYPDQPVLVEEYIEGREITAGIMGNDPPQVFGLMEIVNKARPGEDVFYSLETKRDWKNLVDYASPPDIDKLLDNHLRHYAIMTFHEFGCRDIARIDFRISKNNKIFLLEINPLPGLSPEYADLVIMAKKIGISYDKLIMSIFKHALSRYKHVDTNIREAI